LLNPRDRCKDEEYSRAKQRGVTLQQVPIAIDGIAFFVHPKLPIKQLSLDQLQKILTGKITNWQQLGGPNLSVVPFIFDPKLASSTLRLLLESPEN
jgi:phosphate transport system substrate-binding protein